ncbi:unnamed protein product [[Candida] boidinii]|uniref:Unnamed protein product n=1 Tax=Candida boidinii TaxID=5477 RepID=A0ACB5TJX1_CANBO|nr:unnamed protein product [[Candida] boidinii]
MSFIYTLSILGIYLYLSALSYSFPLNLETDGAAYLDNILASDRNFRNLPPIISVPKESQRTIPEGEIPQYVIDYAPLVHLYSEEKYLPYDIKEFVTNLHAEFYNGTRIPGFEDKLKITDLEKLQKYNKAPDKLVYLTSNKDVDKDPEFITGKKNIPRIIDGKIVNAPAVLIVMDKGNGWVDSYWFYFYSFNLGPFVMGCGPYGNHVGDWEHSLVRFHNGKPIITWMSAHGGGGGYMYTALEKFENDDKRPIIFSARGTHANYASVGQHSHDLPYSILSDFTDRGPLWDPSQNYLAYTYDAEISQITFANGSVPFRESEYGYWLKYRGAWGDKKLDPSDPRQHWSPWEYKYIDGPTGPITKHLTRVSPCQRAKWWNFWNGCNLRRYPNMGEGVEREGPNCGHLLNFAGNGMFRYILEVLTWGGWGCWFFDLILG